MGHYSTDWDALNTLASLRLPPDSSLSLDADMLQTLCSSGSIPIFLDPGIRVSESLASSISSSFPSDSSNYTVNTIGTFGPRHSGIIVGTSRVHDYLNSSNSERFAYATPTKQAFHAQSPSPHLLTPTRSEEHSIISPFRDDTSPSPSPSKDFQLHNHHSQVVDRLGFTQEKELSRRTQSTCNTTSLDPVMASLSPHPILVPAPGTSTARPRSPLQRLQFTNRSRDGLAEETSHEISPRIHRFMAKKSPIHVPPNSPTPPQRNNAGRAPLLDAVQAGSRTKLPRSRNIKTPNLPEALSWLQTGAIKLWIDQEGFRSVRAVLKLAGFSIISTEASNDEITNALTCTRVDFRPAKRQSFVFHHSALDALPVLRQLTLVGDDNKDYISRQASLSLKPNGVYAVTGLETFEPIPAGHLQSPSKLTWRFEYVVDDLRDSKGKIISGEKTLTPLAFSCSPGFLHPSRGKKTKIMYLFKKTFTFKLAAERMEAPKPPKNFHPVPPLTRPAIPGTPRLAQGSEPPRIGRNPTTHRRAHSSIDPTIIIPNPTSNNADAHLISKRHRPVSITALNELGKDNSQQPQGHPSLTERRRSLTAPTLKLVRHILPPSELSDLVSAPVLTTPSSSPSTLALRPPTHHIRGCYF